MEGCGKKDALIFTCNYCHKHFCADHHLPENHNCEKLPKTTPDYLRPREPKPQKPMPEHEPQKVPKENWKIPLVIGIAIVVLSCFLLISGAIVPSPLTPSLTHTPAPSISNPSSITPAPIIATTPTPATSYVEVDYRTVGWFYGIPQFENYNYTYLVLNVTVTNHGYSQVNVIGNNGFSVAINSNDYTPMLSTIWNNQLFNGTVSDYGYQIPYSFSSDLPSQAILLDTGSVNGIVIFQLGSPNVYPQQPQILNEPFSLKYSVSYGDSVPLLERQIYDLGPYAKVEVNQR